MSVVRCFETKRAAEVTEDLAHLMIDVRRPAVLEQAPLLNGLELDAFTSAQDGVTPREIGLGWGETVQAVVVALVIVVLEEGGDLRLEVARQVVVLQQDAVLQGLMPALDLSLGLRMAGRATDVFDAAVVQPFGEIASEVTRAVVGEQPWPMPHPRLLTA